MENQIKIYHQYLLQILISQKLESQVLFDRAQLQAQQTQMFWFGM